MIINANEADPTDRMMDIVGEAVKRMRDKFAHPAGSTTKESLLRKACALGLVPDPPAEVPLPAPADAADGAGAIVAEAENKQAQPPQRAKGSNERLSIWEKLTICRRADELAAAGGTALPIC